MFKMENVKIIFSEVRSLYTSACLFHLSIPDWILMKFYVGDPNYNLVIKHKLLA
jgi:hypothetical protein